MLKIKFLLAAFFVFFVCRGSILFAAGSKQGRDSIIREIELLNKKAKQLNRDATNEAIAYAYKSYLLAYENNFQSQQAAAQLILGEGYLYNDMYDLALEYAFNALKIYRKNGQSEDIAATYTLLGWIYYDVENAELSLKYHEMAYKLYKRIGNEHKAAVSLNGLGLNYQLKNDFKSAALYFRQVLMLAKKDRNRLLISAAYNNLGICSNNAEAYKQAVEYFQLALKYSTGQVLSMAETHNQMAFSMVNLGRYQSAQESLNQSYSYIQRSTSNSRKENLLDYYKVLSLLNKLKGNYRLAYENIQNYTAIREELLSKNKVNALLSLTMKREAQEKEEQIKSLSNERTLRANQRNMLIIIVFLLVVIGIMLFNKLRNRQRKNAALAEIKQMSLSNKLEFNNTELKNHSLFMTQRNEVIRNFIEELTVMEKSGKEDLPQQLHKLVNKFRYDINIEKYVEDFNMQIEDKYQDFFYNLKQKFPKLTQNEMRLCAQIRLNLSIKEIASLNNISVKSVEMARYRLRKHFMLSSKDNLNEFLSAF